MNINYINIYKKNLILSTKFKTLNYINQLFIYYNDQLLFIYRNYMIYGTI